MERGKPGAREAVKAAYRAVHLVHSALPDGQPGGDVRLALGACRTTSAPTCAPRTCTASRTSSWRWSPMFWAVVFCTTDAGRGRWAESPRQGHQQGPHAQGASSRNNSGGLLLRSRTARAARKPSCWAVLGDVAGLDIDLFDDMIRRGSTAIDAGKGYRNGTGGKPDSACKKIRFVASHGVLPGNCSGEAPEGSWPRASCSLGGHRHRQPSQCGEAGGRLPRSETDRSHAGGARRPVRWQSATQSRSAWRGDM